MIRIKWNAPLRLLPLESLWHHLFAKPCTWLFLCFFQPGRFRALFEHQGFFRRVPIMLSLAIPLFLFSLLFALPVQSYLFSCAQSCTFSPIFPLSLTLLYEILPATLFGVICGLIVGMLGDVGLGIILALTLGITGIVVGNVSVAFVKGLAVAITFGLIAGTGRGFQWGIRQGVIGSILCGFSWALLALMSEDMEGGIIRGGIIRGGIMSGMITVVFFVSYMVGYYRLLLYPVSGPSGLRAYLASRKNPSGIFGYLHTSALYWDECIFLPLPNLRQTLLKAVGQNMQQALVEIAFVIDYREQQRQAALAASFEIALRDMEQRKTIRDIANASQRLTEILPPAIRLLAPALMTPFTHLDAASREAARYQGPLNWHMRRAALEQMTACLEKIYPDTIFLDGNFTTLLKSTIGNWRKATSNQQEKLEHGLEEFGQISNPYNPGHASNTPFVGRDDIVRQLSMSLSKQNRLTFLLNGERRMGKSTMLRRLPTLLGASYISVFCDLQNPSFYASIHMFLEKLAEQIYQEVSFRGVSIAKIEPTRLQEAFNRNEATIYHPFDQWLDGVERALQAEKRTVLLLFDEFEKLAEAAAAQHLKLNLLLDWFRNTIQNRSHIVFLFSGIQTFADMGTSWAGYFVNAKTLKMSFLHPKEAHLLIMQPVPNFPSQELFAEEVVAEIIRVTGCHPFLIQAVCSELIDTLNLENREQAEIQDVATAVASVFDGWNSYFQDMWERTNLQQRTCLKILRGQEERKKALFTQHSGLDEQTVHETLQALLKRDLIRRDEDSYQIAVPMFDTWIARNT